MTANLDDFEKFTGRRVSPGTIKQLQDQTPSSCADACVAKSGCRGFNLVSGGAFPGKCTLKSFGGLDDEAGLMTWSGMDHYSKPKRQGMRSLGSVLLT